MNKKAKGWIAGGVAAALAVSAVTAGLALWAPWDSGKWKPTEPFSVESCINITKKGEDLKVLQITDLHVDHTNQQHDVIWARLERIVKENDQDLTVITGDWTSDEENLPATEKLIEIMERCAKPWAVIFGNHDSEGKVSRPELGKLFEKAPHCLFQPGPEGLSGTGNYVINVWKDQQRSHLDQSLVLFDSHASTPPKTAKYDHLKKDQLAWYRWNVEGLQSVYEKQEKNESKTIPSMVFLHIPLNEYEDAWEHALTGSGDHLHGSVNEYICPPAKNPGAFKLFQKLGSTKAVFAGHDHSNDAAVNYEGILLCYGLQTGICESDPYAKTLKKGGNLITMKNDGTVRVKQVY